MPLSRLQSTTDHQSDYRAGIRSEDTIRIFVSEIFEYLFVLIYIVFHKATPCFVSYKFGNRCPTFRRSLASIFLR